MKYELQSLEKTDGVSIVVPVYNEMNSLEELYQKIREILIKTGRDWEIYFIDDGSEDDSSTILKRLAKEETRVKVIYMRRNFGQTSAIMAGFDHANYEIIIPIDADLQNDPSDIPRLIDKLNEGYHVVSGWRKDRKDSKFRRTFLSKVANRIISTLSRVPLHDYGCSLKAYRKIVLQDIRLYGEMHRFIPIYAFWNGAKVTEIPVEHHPRKAGKSKYGMERIVKVILDLFVVLFLHKYAQKPIYIFGGFGLFCMGTGLLLLIYSLYMRFYQQIPLIKTPIPALSASTFITGIFSMLLGFLAELITRTYHESQNKKTYKISKTLNIN